MISQCERLHSHPPESRALWPQVASLHGHQGPEGQLSSIRARSDAHLGRSTPGCGGRISPRQPWENASGSIKEWMVERDFFPSLFIYLMCLSFQSCEKYSFINWGWHSQSYGVSSSHVQMWELDYKEGWAPKNWFFQIVVPEKTSTLLDPLEGLLESKIKPVKPKGNQTWIFIGRTDAEAEAPILWPPGVKSQLMEKPWY